MGFRLAYTRPERRSDAELATLAGQHVHAHNTDYNLNASLGIAYGVTHHLTISAELPYVRRDDLREGTHDHSGGLAVNSVEQLGSVCGIGDLSLLAKYRLTAGTGPGLALISGVKMPTGSTGKRSLQGERLETEHQPGTGSWDPILGASASAPMGPVGFTASLLYQFSGRGAQHTRLGDRLQGGIALSHRFGAPPHSPVKPHNHHHGDEARRATRGTAALDLGCVCRIGRRMGGQTEGRRRNRSRKRWQMGLSRAGAAFHRGVGLVGDRSRCVAGVAADPRLASRQPLPVHAVTGPRLLTSREG